MKQLTQVIPVVLVAVAGALMVWFRGRGQPAIARSRARRAVLASLTGDIGLVAARELQERIRGKVFRVSTVLILMVVAAAIVIPVLNRGRSHSQQVGVVGARSSPLRTAIAAAGVSTGTAVHLVPEASTAAARDDLRSGRVSLAIIDARELMVGKAIGPTDSSTTAQLTRALSQALGEDEASEAVGLSAAQAARLARTRALPVTSLQPGAARGVPASTALVGLFLVFVMLTQYNGWTLIGVMEEKSSRVVEVLLAAIRPVQLLAGKVLGIGLAAFAQATVIAAVAIGLGEAVGSDLLRGTAPLVLVSTLVWLVLGYAFYCWVYAAAGSLAERQDQVQSLILPLSLPVIFAFIMAQTVLASGTPSTFFEVLGYLPPTAPFAMPVLVSLGRATWWEFATSAAISILGTIGVARLATSIYRRAILRTGRRVRLREVVFRAAR